MLRALLIIPLMLLLIGCDQSSPAAAPPPATQRVVALSPAIARLLDDIGAGDLIVGRHGYDIWTDQSVTVCGDQDGIDYEALLAVRPTVVFIEWGKRPPPPKLLRLAERHRWHVDSFELLTLDDIKSVSNTVGTALGEPYTANADALVADLTTAWQQRPPRDVGRILVIFGVGPVQAFGPGSFHNQILARLGIEPAIAAGTPYQELDAEDVFHLAPDGIILFKPRLPNADAVDPTLDDVRRELGALANLRIPAIQNDRIGIVDHTMGLTPTSSLIEVTDDIARMIDGWEARRPSDP